MPTAEQIVSSLLEENPKDLLMDLGDQADKERASGEINSLTARSITPGTVLYHKFFINTDGSPTRARVSGRPKFWKRDPNRFEIPWKHGMYTHGRITADDADDWTLVEPEGVDQKVAKLRKSKLGKRWDDLRVKLPGETPESPKSQIMGDPALPKMVADRGDMYAYVEDYMLEYLPTEVVTPENVQRVLTAVRRLGGGFPGVYDVFAAIEDAGLARRDDLEAAFHADNNDAD